MYDPSFGQGMYQSFNDTDVQFFNVVPANQVRAMPSNQVARLSSPSGLQQVAGPVTQLASNQVQNTLSGVDDIVLEITRDTANINEYLPYVIGASLGLENQYFDIVNALLGTGIEYSAFSFGRTATSPGAAKDAAFTYENETANDSITIRAKKGTYAAFMAQLASGIAYVSALNIYTDASAPGDIIGGDYSRVFVRAADSPVTTAFPSIVTSTMDQNEKTATLGFNDPLVLSPNNGFYGFLPPVVGVKVRLTLSIQRFVRIGQ